MKYQIWLTGVASSMWPMRSRRTLVCDLHAAAVADLALIADLLILAAVALPVMWAQMRSQSRPSRSGLRVR